MYEVTQKTTSLIDMNAYEVSNHARAGSESKHNLIYWRYGDYVGVGPGAHGRITSDEKRIATEAVLNPEDWLSLTQRQTHGQLSNHSISTRDQAEEYLMMSLRLEEGADIDRFTSLYGDNLNQQVIEDNIELGFLQRTDSRLRATSTGRMILNKLLSDLLVA